MSKKTIAINTFEPAISAGDYKSSAGGYDWLERVILGLKANGNEVIWVSNPKDEGHVFGRRFGKTLRWYDAIEKADVVFMPWRWYMSPTAYPRRWAAFDAQWNILNSNIPVVVHDEDHMIEESHLRMLSKRAGIQYTTPAFFPQKGFETLHFPYPFPGCPVPHTINRKFDKMASKDFEDENLIMYIGNNYERYDQAELFLGGTPTTFWGNWMEPSKGRQSPEKVLRDFPKASFKGRLAQIEVLNQLCQSLCTIALHKPSYGDVGFMTIRWAEAVAAGTLLFVPSTLQLPYEMETDFDSFGLIVNDGNDLRYNLAYLLANKSKYLDAVMMQQEHITKFMDLAPWIKMLGD